MVYLPMFPRTMHTCLGVFLVWQLAGCASLTPEQCKLADWASIGMADGSHGESAARINDHAKACAEVGVRPDLPAYLRGRAQGLLHYCQAENAFKVGRGGAANNSEDCPQPMQRAFAENYQDGHELHRIESQLSQLMGRLDHEERQYRSADERIQSIRSDLKAKDLSTERRTALLSEYDRLVEKKEALLRSRIPLQVEVERLRAYFHQRQRELGRQ